VLYCTYWIRFEKDGDTHQAAAKRVKVLFEAAAAAGVEKIVFSAHTRASTESPFSYISGKAQAVNYLRELSEKSGINYSVVRPCGIFGATAQESILMNNAAWVLRRTPLFLLAGDGTQKFQPVHVQDMAELMADLGSRSLQTSGEEKDACGPDAPTAKQLFTHLAKASGARYSLVTETGLPTKVISTLTQPINWMTGDILLDDDDLDLMATGLTVANDPEDPLIAKRRSLLDWCTERGTELGQNYISSMSRYYYKR